MLLTILAVTAMGQQALHPIFRVDRDELVKAYEKGKEAAKKKAKWQKVERTWAKDVGKTRSPNWASFTAPYVVFLPHPARAEFMGFDDQRQYKDDSEFQEFVKGSLEIAEKTPQERLIRFGARLFAWPGVSEWDNSINRAAREEDVRNVKFVLLIDGEKPLHPLVAEMRDAQTASGSVSIPEYKTIYGSSTTTGSATAVGPGGVVTATGTARTSSTVTYRTERIEGYNVYMADYDLIFPLYDKDGKPNVGPEVKQLVIKVIYPSGEHTGVFKLSDYLRKK